MPVSQTGCLDKRMSKHYEIRADFDRETIVVYQAYNKAIALPAIETGTFQSPFSFNRMTWIKPSFLWLMARSNWGAKARPGIHFGRAHQTRGLGTRAQ